MIDDLIIHSVNIGQNHSALSSLLQLTVANVVLIQEPSWVHIVPGTSDLHPEGIECWGTVNHPLWESYIPPCSQPFAPNDRPRVATFVCKSLLCSYSVSSLPSFSSFCCVGIEIATIDQRPTGTHGSVSVSSDGNTADVPSLEGARETKGAIMAMASAPMACAAYAPQRAPETLLALCEPVGLSPSSPSQALCLLNFYHYTSSSPPLLHPLFLPLLDHCMPHLLAGDFNTHSPTWSPPHVKHSPWHDDLENWFNQKGFVSMVPEGAITWCCPHRCGSLLNLLLLNDAALVVPSFPCTCCYARFLGTFLSALWHLGSLRYEYGTVWIAGCHSWNPLMFHLSLCDPLTEGYEYDRQAVY